MNCLRPLLLATLTSAWRGEMMVLGVIVFAALVLAVLVAKQSPDSYGMKPFGAMPAPAGGAAVPRHGPAETGGAARAAIPATTPAPSRRIPRASSAASTSSCAEMSS